MGGDRDEPLREWCNGADHPPVVLVGHHAHQENDLPVRKVRGEALCQLLCAVRIVGAVDDHQGIFAQDLEAARPTGLLQPFAQCLFRDVPAVLLQHVHRIQHAHHVYELIVRDKGDLQIPAVSIVEDLSVQRLFSDRQQARIGNGKRAVQFFAGAPEHG